MKQVLYALESARFRRYVEIQPVFLDLLFFKLDFMDRTQIITFLLLSLTTSETELDVRRRNSTVSHPFHTINGGNAARSLMVWVKLKWGHLQLSCTYNSTGVICYLQSYARNLFFKDSFQLFRTFPAIFSFLRVVWRWFFYWRKELG